MLATCIQSDQFIKNDTYSAGIQVKARKRQEKRDREQTLTESHKWLSETLVQMHSFLKVFTANYLINGFTYHRHAEDGTSQDIEKMRKLGTSRLPPDETSSVGKSRALKCLVTQEYY